MVFRRTILDKLIETGGGEINENKKENNSRGEICGDGGD